MSTKPPEKSSPDTLSPQNPPLDTLFPDTEMVGAESTAAPQVKDPKVKRINRITLLVLLSASAVLLFSVVRPFVVPLVLAAAFTSLFFPFYRLLVRLMKGKRIIASLICCFALVAGLLGPAYAITHLVAKQAVELYSEMAPKVIAAVRQPDQGAIGRIRQSSIIRNLESSGLDWRAAVGEAVSASGNVASMLINRTSAGFFSMAGTVFTMLLTMFYLFLDGPRLMQRMRYLSPLRDEYEETLISRFQTVSQAAVKGTLLIGLIQGGLGALTLLICGIDTWLLWGFVMVILSIIPLVGGWLVLIPAAIIQLLVGNIWQGVVILALHFVVIANIDNVLRPVLVGRGARMHDLMILFSTLGGIGAFGVVGFIIGPVIAALFITVLDICGEEFRPELIAAQDEQPHDAAAAAELLTRSKEQLS